MRDAAGAVFGRRLYGRENYVLAAESSDGFKRLMARAFADGKHRDNAPDAEDHAQHRQERTHLVAPHVGCAELYEGPVKGEP